MSAPAPCNGSVDLPAKLANHGGRSNSPHGNPALLHFAAQIRHLGPTDDSEIAAASLYSGSRYEDLLHNDGLRQSFILGHGANP